MKGRLSYRLGWHSSFHLVVAAAVVVVVVVVVVAAVRNERMIQCEKTWMTHPTEAVGSCDDFCIFIVDSFAYLQSEPDRDLVVGYF